MPKEKKCPKCGSDMKLFVTKQQAEIKKLRKALIKLLSYVIHDENEKSFLSVTSNAAKILEGVMRINENKEVNFETLKTGDVRLILEELPCCGGSDTMIMSEYPASIECPLCGTELIIEYEGKKQC